MSAPEKCYVCERRATIILPHGSSRTITVECPRCGKYMTHAEALPIFVKLQDEPDLVHRFPEAINRVWQGDGVPFVTVVQTPVGERLTITPRNTKMTKAEKKSRRRHGRTNPVQGVWIWAEKERK